jgi:hypothetical protein
VVTLNLTINNSNTGIDSITACDSYTWIDGITYTASTSSPTFTLTNAVGCDSIVRLDLTIDTLDLTITKFNDSLVANDVNASAYQWYNCETGIEILGATERIYIANINGSYAVIVTKDSCSAMSECYEITTVGKEELLGEESGLNVYPNPNNGNFFISSKISGEFSLINTMGQTIQSVRLVKGENVEVNLGNVASGFYYLIGIDQNNRKIAQKISVRKQ